MPVPQEFLDRLKLILPQGQYDPIVETFSKISPVVFRINLLKITAEDIFGILRASLIPFDLPASFPYSFVVSAECKISPVLKALVDEGKIYQQGLSSMLPVEVMAPKPEERILDMCAAPGSKTSQMAMLMENSGQIVAIESAHQRYYKLKAVLVLLGVENVKVIFKDARLYRDHDLFDAVLADVPCSSEGRFSMDNEESYAYWSTRKIKEMQHKQKGLLLSASRLVRPGGRIIYSTCTFAPEENEGVIDWFLKKMEAPFSVEKIDLKGVESYPAVLSWGKKEFNLQVSKCLRVFPNKLTEGFFIAHLKRLD